MKTVGLIYSYKTTKTAGIAEKIAKEIGVKEVKMVDADALTEETFLSFDNLILGSPTWFDGELAVYWDEFMPALEDLKLKGKKIAIFGLGDQEGYPENFLDAIGILGNAVEKQGATLIGFTNVKGYDYEESVAERDGQFIGLGIDLEKENGKKVNSKIKSWCKNLKEQFD